MFSAAIRVDLARIFVLDSSHGQYSGSPTSQGEPSPPARLALDLRYQQQTKMLKQ